MSIALEELLKLEEEFVFSSFTNDTAVEIGLKLYENARKQGKTITIDIIRKEQRLFFLAMEGATTENEEWIRRKNNMANRFGHNSFYLSTKLKESGKSLEELFEVTLEDYAPNGGAFPIIIKGEGIVGTITVSGLPEEEDHAMVVGALRSFF